MICRGEASEEVLVEAFIAEPVVESPDDAVLHRLPVVI